jgi:hypothetical protein
LIDLIIEAAKEKLKSFSFFSDGTGKSKNLVAPDLILLSIVFNTVDAVSTSTPGNPFTALGCEIASSTNNG